MGQTNKRIGKDGKPRYTAVYVDARGVRRSAGTFAKSSDADDAWQDAEAKVREGRGTALVRGQQNFERYVRDKWFPNHRLELRSRENYHYYLERWIIPWFKHTRLIEVMPDDVREFVTHLERDDVKPSSIKYCLTILSAIFSTALNDQAVFFHPCRGVTPPTVARKVRKIVTPEEYDLLHQVLGDARSQLLVETDIESGLFSRGAKRTSGSFSCFCCSEAGWPSADSATGVVERRDRMLPGRRVSAGVCWR